MRFEGQAGVSVWIAGIFICLLVVSSTMAIVRSIPASYANTSDEGTPSNGGATSRGSDDAHANSSQTNSTVAQDTIRGRIRASCAECGVIESMRQIERFDDVGKRNTVIAAVEEEVAGREPDRAIGRAIGAKSRSITLYEFTVRFRDGSNKVFNDTSPRAWPLSSRVIVISGPNDSNN